MAIAPLLEALGYRGSRKFIQPAESDGLPASELSFAMRHTSLACEGLTAKARDCRFHGAYVLQEEAGSPAIPVVYVFETETDAEAKEIHRMVWNQSLVPFIIIASPSTIRVYPGFAYSRTEDKPLISVAAVTASALGQLAAFSATAIDDGTLWEKWGHAADPSQRADESLLREKASVPAIGKRSVLGPDRAAVLIRLTNMVDAAGTTAHEYEAGGLPCIEGGLWTIDTVTNYYHTAQNCSGAGRWVGLSGGEIPVPSVEDASLTLGPYEFRWLGWRARGFH